MDEDSFGDVFLPISERRYITLDACFGAGKAERPFHGRAGDPIRIISLFCQRFQPFPAGEWKSQSHAHAVNELPCRNVFGRQELMDLHPLFLPLTGEHILCAAGHMHHIKRLPPKSRCLSDRCHRMIFLMAEYIKRNVMRRGQRLSHPPTNKKGGHV